MATEGATGSPSDPAGYGSQGAEDEHALLPQHLRTQEEGPFLSSGENPVLVPIALPMSFDEAGGEKLGGETLSVS